MNKNQTNLILAIIISIGWFLPLFTRQDGTSFSHATGIYEYFFVDTPSFSVVSFLLFGVASLAIIAVAALYLISYFNNESKFRVKAYQTHFATILVTLYYSLIMIVGAKEYGNKVGFFPYAYHILYVTFGILIYLEHKKDKKDNNQITTPVEKNQYVAPIPNTQITEPIPQNLIKDYFLFDGENQTGPFTITDLKDKVNFETLIWHEGMSEWKKVNEIQDLYNFLNKK
jgi:hypothetical protein